MSICLACHVYTSSCHRLDKRFSAAVFCLQSMSNVYRDLRVMSLSLVDRQGEEGKRTHGQTEQGPSETPSSIFGGELTPPHTTISSELGACVNSVYQVLFSQPMHKAWEQQAVYNVASHQPRSQVLAQLPVTCSTVLQVTGSWARAWERGQLPTILVQDNPAMSMLLCY